MGYLAKLPRTPAKYQVNQKGRPLPRQSPDRLGQNILRSIFSFILSFGIGNTAFAQSYMVVANQQALAGATLTGVPDIYLQGYYDDGDGGQGPLRNLNTTTCSADNGLIFQDHVNNCFERYLPVSDVRQWGAHCDVQFISSPGNTSWVGGAPKLLVQDAAIPGSRKPTAGDFIVISQIGGPTVGRTTGTIDDAVWATKYSQVSGGSGFSKGDVISFDGGTFSQQVTIVVDSIVGTAIGQWHFLWGGLYAASSAPTSMNQSAYSHTSGTGAVLTPYWSGWSLLNNTAFFGGTGYNVGDVILIKGADGTWDTAHPPEVIVEATNPTSGPGAVTAFDWIYYGSFSALPTGSAVLNSTAVTGHGSGFTIGNGTTSAGWTRGPLAATILAATDSPGPPAQWTITLKDITGITYYPRTIPIKYFYYGSDDNKAINKALGSGVANAVSLPGFCGTTKTIELPSDNSGNNNNPALVGQNYESTGLFAFAQPPADRATGQVLTRLLHKDLNSSVGGGFSNMILQGGDVPQGVGFYGEYGTVISGNPTGYVGVLSSAIIPSAGDAVEIDNTLYMKISNVHIQGAAGTGNSIFHCSFDESNPNAGPSNPNGDVGNIDFSNSRMDEYLGLYGANAPSFGLKLENDCHDSVYHDLSVYDGVAADVFEYNGNVFSRIHVNSDAANSGIQLGNIPWSTTTAWPLAGVAKYGIYTIGNTSISQTQCDVASVACIFMDLRGSGGNPGQITDTQMKCGSFVNVPTTYYGVEIPAAATNETVGGTATAASCTIPAAQIVHADSTLDPSVSVCNNSNATVSTC